MDLETRMGEASRMNLKEWQKRRGLSDSDILTPKYLNRIKSESEIVQCACGCGEWRARYDKRGVERRYITGHWARGRKPSAETLRKMRETRWKNSDLNEPEFTRRRLIKKYGPRIEKLFSRARARALSERHGFLLECPKCSSSWWTTQYIEFIGVYILEDKVND